MNVLAFTPDQSHMAALNPNDPVHKLILQFLVLDEAARAALPEDPDQWDTDTLRNCRPYQMACATRRAAGEALAKELLSCL